MKQVILAVVLISILTGCATIVPNVESVSDFEGKKLLIGRFVFSVWQPNKNKTKHIIENILP